MNKIKVDSVICATWIIPVIPEQRTFKDCALIVKDGLILDIVPQNDIDTRFSVSERIELPEQVLIPGLINGHGHAAMSLLRGFADDLPLMTWLEKHIWPAESQWVDERFVKDGTQLAVAEMLLSGCTTFSDMYFFPEVTAKVAHDSGMRAQITFPILDFPTAWGSGPDQYFDKGLELHDQYRSHDRIKIGFGPHAPYTVSDGPLEKIATFAEELQAPIQIHLHETAYEVESALATTGIRPLHRLANLQLLSPLTQCVHMTQVNNEDLALLEQSGAHVIHCPDSNLKLASGLCPVTAMQKAGINVALGTDGAASNNDLNILSEMRQAALLAKYQSNDAESLNAHGAIKMATLNGAKALGIEKLTGSLESGKAADICAIDLSALHHQPVYDAASQIVYSDCSQSVTHTWVNGVALVKNKQLTTISSAPLRVRVKEWKEKIAHA